MDNYNPQIHNSEEKTKEEAHLDSDSNKVSEGIQ